MAHISREEERTLIKLAQQGDQQAYQKLLDIHHGFVIDIIKRTYKPRGIISFEDCKQDGMIGLICAIKEFDLSSNVNLTTYAFWKIRAEIQRSCRRDGDMIKFPPRIKKWRKIYHHWLVKNRFEHCRISLDKFVKYQKLTPNQAELFIKSFNINVVRDSEESFLDNKVVDDTLNHTEKSDDKFYARKLIGQISNPRCREFIKMRFGIDYDKSHTLNEIGDHYGLTKERVRQLCDRTLRELRAIG